MSGRILAALGLALLGVIGCSAMLLRNWPLINVVETGHTPEYPDVIPRLYQATEDRVFDAALHAVNRLPRWSVVRYNETKGEVQAEARTLALRFVDDVMIHIAEQGGATTVHVKSASRVGRGDFGQNARNIRAFFAELDTQMHNGVTH
ncbi:MAG: DUF1499 domain-containing protein [Nitrospiraceae bacterium]